MYLGRPNENENENEPQTEAPIRTRLATFYVINQTSTTPLPPSYHISSNHNYELSNLFNCSNFTI